MSISSIDSSSMAELLSQYYYQNRTANNNTNCSNSTSTVDSLKGVTSINSDGDTFQMSGLTQLSIAVMYSKMDTDGDDSVSKSEFGALRPSDVTEEKANNLYSSFDTDSSGSLSESEFETAMNNVLSLNTVSATSTNNSTASTQSTSAGGGGMAAASSSCPVGNSTCTSCGQCGKTTLSSSSSTQNTNTQTSISTDYLSSIAMMAYEMNSVYL
ncbi:EF-hand domain-containing protein [Sporomusa termitida]|uniref:EF-hand domain-containing protein n=1 Tax=Sporomusa termitida TaxID=2377 RepID=A0A517DRH1_9FIRM|nr:EF-hand domain-containing protein [Sporomusa termitida]QDR79943.1 hypothetical protein SPTER_12470 [Sporomusa termitida]